MPTTANTEDVLIDAHEAARLLGVRIGTLRYWEKTGRVPAGRLFSARGKRWRAGEIIEAAAKLGGAA